MVKILIAILAFSFYSQCMQVPEQFDYLSALPDEMKLKIIYKLGTQSSSVVEIIKSLQRLAATCARFNILLKDKAVPMERVIEFLKDPTIYRAIELTTEDVSKNVLWTTVIEKIIQDTDDVNAAGPEATISPFKYAARTPLMFAARKRDTFFLRLLLKVGARVNEKCLDRTALHEAISYRRAETVKLLLASGADGNLVDDMKVPPLILGLQSRNLGIVQLLINAGAHINEKYYSTTALHEAVWIRSHTAIKLLLDSGADINITDSTEMTPLQRAISQGHLESIRAFAESGIKVADSVLGKIAFDKAITQGRDEGVKLLQENKPKITQWIASLTLKK